MNLRLRMAYYFYDADGDGRLTVDAELREMVRELVSQQAKHLSLE